MMPTEQRPEGGAGGFRTRARYFSTRFVFRLAHQLARQVGPDFPAELSEESFGLFVLMAFWWGHEGAVVLLDGILAHPERAASLIARRLNRQVGMVDPEAPLEPEAWR